LSSYKTDQHKVSYRGREFHFVSYEGRVANPRTGETASPPTWFLMSAGKRWPAIVQTSDLDAGALTTLLTKWLDQNVFASG
jgi:hypothetical protein